MLVQEVNRTYVRRLDCDTWARKIRERVLHVHGVTVETILFVPPLHLPRTTSGKIRRSRAKTMFINDEWPKILGVSSAEAFRSTMDTTAAWPEDREGWERFVAARVAEQLALPVDDIERDVPFMELGLDSAKALAVIDALQRTCSVSLPVVTLFNHNTIERLSIHLHALALQKENSLSATEQGGKEHAK